MNPHEQMWVDVGKLIHDQMPDKNGLLLPPDLMMGSYELQDLTDRGVGNLYEGKVIVDKTFGHVAYGCATCCGFFASPWMYYDPIGVGLGATSTQGVWDMDACTGGDVSVTDYFGDWNTGNHAIATASKAVITGVAVGSTTNSATGTLTIGNINSLRCPQEQTNPSGPVNTGVTVTIFTSDCFTAPNPFLTGGWSTPGNPLSCGLAGTGPPLPAGGVCKPNYSGIKNCYTVYNSTTDQCTSYCPGTTRTENSACTAFIDEFPVVQVSFEGACPNQQP